MNEWEETSPINRSEVVFCQFDPAKYHPPRQHHGHSAHVQKLRACASAHTPGSEPVAKRRGNHYYNRYTVTAGNIIKEKKQKSIHYKDFIE